MLIPLMLKIKKDVDVIAINESFCFHVWTYPIMQEKIILIAKNQNAFMYPT